MAEPEKPKTDKLIQIQGIFSLFFIIGILVLNFILIYPVFSSAFTQFINSYEAVYISEARFIAQNFPHLSYDSLWHLGFPFYLFYNPLLPFLIAFFHFILGFDFSYLYRFITGVAYLAAPVTLYIFVKYLTRKELPAVVAALAYSTQTNIFAWLSPGLSADLIKYGFVPWKLISWLVYGQGPHIVALALIPVSCLFFLHTLKYPTLKYYILSAVFTALVALTHWPSFVILLILLGTLLFSEIILGQTFRKIKTAFWCLLLAYGFSAFWLNPNFLARSYTLGGEQVIASWVNLIPISFVVVPISVTVLFLIFDRRPRLQPFLVGFLYFLFPFLVIMAYNLYGKTLVPKPDFLMPELHMGLVILFSVVLTIFLTVLLRVLKYRLNDRVYYITNICIFVLTFGIFIYLASLSVSPAHKLARGVSNLNQTSEIQITRYLATERKEGRVLAFGNTAAWLNAFSDLPQVAGFSELGNNHDYLDQGIAEIQKAQDEKTVFAWLSILNVKYLVVSSDEAAKYENFLEPKAQSGNLVVFEVPLENASLLKIVDLKKLESLNFDGSPGKVQEYQKILEENKSPQILDWPKNNKINIATNLKENQGILVQITWDKGFGAKSSGGGLKVEKAPADFVLLKPEKIGSVNISLYHHLPTCTYCGYAITFLTILYLVILQIKPVRKFIMWREPKITPGVLIKPEPISNGNQKITPELAENTKRYYRDEEDVDWVRMSDQFGGLVSFYHQNREKLVRKLVAQFGKGRKYLDAGCGTGLLLRHLPAGSIGLDINPRAIAKAKKYAPNAALVCADIEQIPFPGEMFDTVLVVDVLDRLPVPDRAIQEIQRVLKNDGVLIGTVPALNPLWRLQFLSTEHAPTEPYRKEYTKKEIKKLLRPFKIIHLSLALSNMTWAFVVKKV